jgi:branched-chain amino acid aminotransferase
LPSKAAKAAGFAEVIYLDAKTHSSIEEVGAANFFSVRDGVLSTPSLTGTILPGITRASVIELARSRGYDVREERVSVEAALDADEAFCCGTAAVISPIGSITHLGERHAYGDGTPGPVTVELYEALTAIQSERAPDTFGWLHEVPLLT